MSDPVLATSTERQSSGAGLDRPQPTNLADVLDRVLDKGLVIVGDIRVNLLDIELLTIKLRLLIASVDTARQMGIDWWEHDPWLSSESNELLEENRRLRRELAAAEPDGGRRRGDRGPEELEANSAGAERRGRQSG
ncbi:MAG TPA: gas vesicle protein GvpJ [Acidimicrobiales bacterium]|nr:gas vesicle protein GvpJ [Acidimicrobiales bacterium]